MEHENRVTRKIAFGLLASILLLPLAGNLAAQEAQKMKKFLTKTLVIEDQGSFFVGGVPKVTNYAVVPAADRKPSQNQITNRQQYVQFTQPANKQHDSPH